ncbi:MAG: hypothetical protein AAFQ51_19335, partial [Pseudomonadota bacterium]
MPDTQPEGGAEPEVVPVSLSDLETIEITVTAARQNPIHLSVNGTWFEIPLNQPINLPPAVVLALAASDGTVFINHTLEAFDIDP